MIEGNLLTQEQVSSVVRHHERFPGWERDEREVLGYYAALERAEQIPAAGSSISAIQIAPYALVMAEGRKKVKPAKDVSRG